VPDGTNTCSIKIVATSTNYIEYNLWDMNASTAFVDGWNTVVIPENHAQREESSWTDATDWLILQSIQIRIVSGATVNTSWDYAYIRKTSVFDDDNGSKSRPPKAKYCSVSPHGDRVLLACTENITDEKTGATYLWYSDTYDIDTYNVLNYVAFPTSITWVVSHENVAHVFTDKEHYTMIPNYGASDFNTSNAVDWRIGKMDGYGCVAGRTVATGTLGENSGIFYLSRAGLRFSNSQSSVDISGPVGILFQDRISGSDFYADSALASAMDDACAAYINGQYYLSYRGLSSDSNDKMLVLDAVTGQYVSDSMSSTVYPTILTLARNSAKKMKLYSGDAAGDIYTYDNSRTVYTDNSVAYQSDFQTPYIGAELMRVMSWEVLNLWVRSDEVTASSIIVKVFRLEDWDDNTDYTEWQEELGTAYLTVTTAWTPNTSANFKWHRLRIPLRDASTPLYPTSRMISLKIYDDNDQSVDYMLESIVCTPMHDELS